MAVDRKLFDMQQRTSFSFFAQSSELAALVLLAWGLQGLGLSAGHSLLDIRQPRISRM